MLEDAEKKGIKLAKDASSMESQLQDTQVIFSEKDTALGEAFGYFLKFHLLHIHAETAVL